MTSETDQQFIDRVDLDLDLKNTADLTRLFALARRGAEMQWKPIETAPKIAKRWIVGWFPLEGVNGMYCVIRWSDHYDSWFCNDLGTCLPTHWMPLPPPPKGADE